MNLSKFIDRVSGKWVAVGGNRWIGSKTKQQVGQLTAKLIRNGCKIVTGGAEGVDHAVMHACLKHNLPKNHLKVFLPYTIKKQYEHYRKLEGAAKARKLFKTLLELKKRDAGAVIENRRAFRNHREAANFRNMLIVRHAAAFVVAKPKGSPGTLDAVRKIKRRKLLYIILT